MVSSTQTIRDKEASPESPHASSHNGRHREEHGQTRPDGHRPISSLARELIGEVQALVTGEVALAKTEAFEKVGQIQRAIASSAIGAGLLACGILTLVAASVFALGLVWPLWLSALVVGAVITIVGALMLSGARSRMSAEQLKPERTMESLRSDRELARERGSLATEGAQ